MRFSPAHSLPKISAAQPWRWPAQSRARLGVLAQAAALFTLFSALFALVQYATPALADHDGYYHLRLAQLMRVAGFKPPFVWLPLSLLSPASYYDHHFLHHVYLSLFAGSADPAGLIQGGKLASVFMPALAFVAAWWLLRGQNVRGASLWALGLFAMSEAFLYRLSMPRAQAASLLILILGLHWLLQRRYAALLPLGLIYVWWYNAFPLLLVIAGAYAAAALLTERRLEWRAVAYPALGIALGLIINPYFPQNLTFIAQHVLPKIGPAATATAVGNEWYPYQTWTLVENSGPALAVFLLGALALGWRGRRMDRPTLTAFFLAAGFGFMLFKSRRFVEYYPAFALLFAALSAAPIVDEWLTTPRTWAWPRPLAGLARVAWARLAPLACLLLLAAPLAGTLRQARAAMAASQPAELYAGASAWLTTHSAPGSLVFQTDWDDFPRLFFYNTQNLYTIGLDPTYMELYDAQLYAEWVALTRGEVPQPSGPIHARFGAEFVLTDLKHAAFLKQAAADPGLQEVYRDDHAAIFQVRP
ncbi:MAG: hypothetical protein KA764_21995 [Anaerolineales bacterium]|nr:hypothetical protein [Anaerolineales bacterium]